MIISLLRLQSRQFSDVHLKMEFDEIKSRIYAISGIHEILYANKDLEYIRMQDYFESIIKEIKQTALKDIRFTIKAETILTMQNALYCGLIVNELITNAAKHAFDDEPNPAVSITLSQNADQTILEFQDNGCGFDAGHKKSTSLGTTLIDILATQQLHGSIESQSGSKGTHYSIRFEHA
jgi:two-component sensor histidine kinase